MHFIYIGLAVIGALAVIFSLLVWLGSNDWGAQGKIICRDCENGTHK